MVQPECPTYTEKQQIIKNKPRRRTTRWILHLAWIKTKNVWKNRYSYDMYRVYTAEGSGYRKWMDRYGRKIT